MTGTPDIVVAPSATFLRPDSPWLIRIAGATVACLAALAFVLSFSALRDLAALSGVAPELTWLWPLVVDGNIVINAVAGVALRPRGRSATWYPWTALIVFAAISVTGNALHAGAATGLADLGVGVAAAVSAVPSLALLQSTHLFVVMLSPPAPRTAAAERAGSDGVEPLHGREGEAIRSGLASVTDTQASSVEAATSGDKPVESDPADELGQLVRATLSEERRITGADVARWLGTSERTGRRRLAALARQHEDIAAALDGRPPVGQ